MVGKVKQHLTEELGKIKEAGLLKEERLIRGPQSSRVTIKGKENLLNMCANNYLGLSNHPELVKAAKESLEEWGFGLSSVRFICGTQELHKTLEEKISHFLKTEDTILYTSCFDANGGLFETLLGTEDAVISDELNHASIIDGIRLCKAQRFRYKNNNMEDLEEKLKEASTAKIRLIITDGVFSMDGTVAELKSICDLAEKYEALVAVDDSHAVGFMGEQGRGTHEHWDVFDRVDIITGTLGKALGGASGGYTSGRKEIIDLLRQRSRPYLFSNTVAPAIVGASIKVLEMLSSSTELRDRLHENTMYYRKLLVENGFQINEGIHPIVPIMLGDAVLAQNMAKLLLEKGVYSIGFFYPVVPQGKARIRTQVSAAHTKEDLEFAVKCFVEAREELEF
jgi:glycine C-acetyltransferase